MAIGILAIGLIAVASVFPVSVLQQKRAIDESMGVAFGNSVLASLQGIGIDTTNLYTGTSTGFTRVNWIDPYDPTDIYEEPDSPRYNFDLLYRRPTTNSPVDVIVFVYRRDADTTTDTDTNPDTIAIGVEDDVRVDKDSRQMIGEPTTDTRVYARNQLLIEEYIFQSNPNNPETYTLKVVKAGEVGNAPPKNIDIPAGDDSKAFFLFDDQDDDGNFDADETIVNAVAIVTGTIR